MSEIRVRTNNLNKIKVRLGDENRIKVIPSIGAETLGALNDVDTSNLGMDMLSFMIVILESGPPQTSSLQERNKI